MLFRIYTAMEIYNPEFVLQAWEGFCDYLVLDVHFLVNGCQLACYTHCSRIKDRSQARSPIGRVGQQPHLPGVSLHIPQETYSRLLMVWADSWVLSVTQTILNHPFLLPSFLFFFSFLSLFFFFCTSFYRPGLIVRKTHMHILKMPLQGSSCSNLCTQTHNAG